MVRRGLVLVAAAICAINSLALLLRAAKARFGTEHTTGEDAGVAAVVSTYEVKTELNGDTTPQIASDTRVLNMRTRDNSTATVNTHTQRQTVSNRPP